MEKLCTDILLQTAGKNIFLTIVCIVTKLKYTEARYAFYGSKIKLFKPFLLEND